MARTLRILGWVYVGLGGLLVVVGIIAVATIDTRFGGSQVWVSIVTVGAGAIGALVAALMALAMARVLENSEELLEHNARILGQLGALSVPPRT